MKDPIQKFTRPWNAAHIGKRDRAFTLRELLAVMVIIGLLAGYIGPKYFGQPGWQRGSGGFHELVS
jgi:prepilin-type N-terminal cleavage/methylation domain-containing protein